MNITTIRLQKTTDHGEEPGTMVEVEEAAGCAGRLDPVPFIVVSGGVVTATNEISGADARRKPVVYSVRTEVHCDRRAGENIIVNVLLASKAIAAKFQYVNARMADNVR